MLHSRRLAVLAGAMLMAGATSAPAQEEMSPTPAVPVYFPLGSSSVPTEETAKLDRAVRIFRDGDWLVLELAGATDTTGDGDGNLALSVARALAVARGLQARGVAPEQIQLIARGESEPTVPTPDGTPEPENRVVEITWR